MHRKLSFAIKSTSIQAFALTMCGITGWFSPAIIEPYEEHKLARMVKILAHRGPDGNGAQVLNHAALGHARLAIIDARTGAQPMTSHDSRFSIVFNGEIYNYKTLRDQLVKKGHQFHTRSDTEVIIELYRALGIDGFARLRGMYAFALWDHKLNYGLLVRDRLGIKPLFVRRDANGTLTFGSEIKAILAKELHKGELDAGNLHLLLNFRYIPGHGSLFRDIEQLPAGTVLEWHTDGTLRHHPINESTHCSGSVLDALRDSINLHLTADVEVGTYLSGGIDSAIITAISKDSATRPIRTFTLNVGDDPNEASYAARSAELLGVNNTVFEVRDEIAKTLPKLVWHLEIPKVNAVQVSQLARLTSKHVKVVLSGLGGDELFFGYNAHRIMLKATRASQFAPLTVAHAFGSAGAKIISLLQKPVWTETERALRMLQSLGQWPRVYGLLRNVWDNPKLRQLIYGPRMLDAHLPNAFDTLETLWPHHTDPVTSMAEFELRHKMVNDLLWQEDRTSMAAGLEVRVPFVDTLFVEHVRRLTRSELMHNNKPKAYMREMLRPVLPIEILNRPKSGFQVSAPDFFHQHLLPMAQDWLSDDFTRKTGVFNPTFVKQVLAQTPGKGLRWHYFILYLMLMTHIWIDIFEN